MSIAVGDKQTTYTPASTAAPPPTHGQLLLWSITSALAGFLFGFDTVVISGAEQTIQRLWSLSAGMHGFALAAALYGTVIGALGGGWPADRWGRKPTLLWVGILYIVSAFGSALAWNVETFIVARFIGGVGIGISTVVAPMYISEISPPEYRGRLAGMFQFNIVFGIVVAFASNAALAGVGANAWRWMLGIAAIPSVIYTLMCVGIPESPRWQVTRQAERTTGFWSKSLAVPIVLAFLIALFNQLSGINAVLYFAPRIFELTGLGRHAALLQSIGIGITNLVFTFVGLWLIDRLGRRTLLTIGSFGYIASLGLCAWAFFTQHFSIVPYCIFAFIASHAVGQGAVIWVFISEIFPNEFRASGLALGCGTHWIFAALITTVFPSVVSAFAPGYVFLFFAFMMTLQLIWVRTMVPETKGIPLEDIQRQLGIRL
ncbi:MAG TPA: MFS transporter [Gemmatimonadaceae bacterium]|nr:MFS transporter [Gemmatimonadaceae bacterium]